MAQKSSSDFVTTWRTNNPASFGNDSSIYINVDSNYIYNYDVDWDNDGVFDTVGISQGLFIQYPSPGVYTIRIRGQFPSIQFGIIFSPTFKDNKSKIIEINQWGNQQWKFLTRAFYGCDSMNCLAVDAPILDSTNSLWSMFADCSVFNGSINHWDVSNIESLNAIFHRAKLFNQPLNNWDVARNKALQYAFYGAESFNQNINSWQVDSVIYFVNTFTGAKSFNMPLNNWNVSRGINLSAMFSYAESFNQNINSWNLTNAQIIIGMFVHAKSYNQPMNNWDVSRISSLSSLFNGAESFNQDISNWNISYVHSISNMFFNAKSFNQNLGNWDLSSFSTAYNAFDSSGMSTANYDSTLIAWEAKYHNRNVHIGSLNLNYCLSDSARNELVKDGWIFVGDSLNCNSVSISEAQYENDFLIFPNPTNSFITIETNVTCKAINIYSIEGKLLVTETSKTIDLSDLPAGNYIIEIQSDNFVERKKVFKL